MGQDVSEFRAEVAPNPKKSYFRVEFEKFTLDLLPVFNGLGKFCPSFKKRKIENLDNTEIPFINYDDLTKINRQMQEQRT